MLDQKSPAKETTLKKGYKYRFYPTPEQKDLLLRTFGCCRKVYNYFLEKSIRDYKNYELLGGTKPGVSGYDFILGLPKLKKHPEYTYLQDVSSVALQQTLSHLGEAYKRFFKNNPKCYPKFKSRKNKQSFTLVGGAFSVIEGQVRIAKSKDPLKIAWSRELPSYPSSCTISMTPSGEYYISFICEYTPKKTSGTRFTGVDAGITDLATLSDGTAIANPRHYVKHQKRLKRLQQRHAKKQLESKNREKARIRLTKLHQRIANLRQDYLHKLTTTLIRDNQAVCIETLMVSNMVKNHCLAKHIMDAAWGRMREMMRYKATDSQHCVLVLAPPYFPGTQMCSDCGLRPKENIKQGTKKWTCEHCGSVHQRDHNAAKNLAQLAFEWYHATIDAPNRGFVVMCPPYKPPR